MNDNLQKINNQYFCVHISNTNFTKKESHFFFNNTYWSAVEQRQDQHGQTCVRYRGKIIIIKRNTDMNTGDLEILHEKCQNNAKTNSAELCLRQFSKHRPSGPMLSISRNFRLSVRVFVRPSVRPSVHFLRYRLTVFLPPLLEVGCPIFFKIRNPWGKVMERSGLTFEHFCLEVV